MEGLWSSRVKNRQNNCSRLVGRTTNARLQEKFLVARLDAAVS